jgi:hypothetical protein
MLRFLFARRVRLIDHIALTDADEAFRRKQAAKRNTQAGAAPKGAKIQLGRKEKT